MPTDDKGIALLLGGAPPTEGAPAEGEPSSDEDLMVAADDVFDAVKADDRNAFAQALHSYVQLCSMKE